MGLRDKLKKSVKRHKVSLSIGDAYVVAFHGDKRASFLSQMKEIQDSKKHSVSKDERINALTVAVSLVDDKGKYPYKDSDYMCVISEMLTTDIEIVVMKSLDINGLSSKSIESDKKKSKKVAK